VASSSEHAVLSDRQRGKQYTVHVSIIMIIVMNAPLSINKHMNEDELGDLECMY